MAPVCQPPLFLSTICFEYPQSHQFLYYFSVCIANLGGFLKDDQPVAEAPNSVACVYVCVHPCGYLCLIQFNNNEEVAEECEQKTKSDNVWDKSEGRWCSPREQIINKSKGEVDEAEEKKNGNCSRRKTNEYDDDDDEFHVSVITVPPTSVIISRNLFTHAPDGVQRSMQRVCAPRFRQFHQVAKVQNPSLKIFK